MPLTSGSHLGESSRQVKWFGAKGTIPRWTRPQVFVPLALLWTAAELISYGCTESTTQLTLGTRHSRSAETDGEHSRANGGPTMQPTTSCHTGHEGLAAASHRLGSRLRYCASTPRRSAPRR